MKDMVYMTTNVNEIWKPIPGFDYYYASNLGRIMHTSYYVTYPDGHRQFVKEHIFKPFIGNKYLCIRVKLHNRRITKNIQNLVALAFIPNPHHYTDVNHKDYNKFNNKPENLEWTTHKYNMNDMQKHYHIQRGTHSKYTWIENKHAYMHPCIDCGKLCVLTAKRCKQCSLKHLNKDQYSLLELQNLLYQNNGNFSAVGRIIHKSGSGIAKRLKHAKLPYHSVDYKNK